MIYTMPVLTTKQIKASLKAVANWSQRAQTICRTFKFEGFLNSIAFVSRITRVAQNLSHYPDIDIRFDQVTLTLTTHDAGGITEKDFSVARQCDEVFLSFLHFDQCRLLAKVVTPEAPEDENGEINETGGRIGITIIDDDPVECKKFYYDGGQVEIAAELVHELDADGNQLRVITLTDYTAEKVRTLCSSPDELRARWADAGQRADIIQQLADRGIDFQTVAAQAGKPEADPFDLLCHLAFNAPILTRRQRADRVKKRETTFFNFFAAEAREILNDLLEKYAAGGELQFTLPDVLKVPPISQHGNVNEIIGKFGGTNQLRNAVNQLQSLLYAA